MFYLMNQNDADPFVNLPDTEPDVCSQERECKRDANGAWVKNGINYLSPANIPPTDLLAIGDRFLSDKSGWFDRRSFKYVALVPAYQHLVGYTSGPKGA